MAPGPGSRLGPYEISGPLGKGGMGEVFRARDTRLHRDVAVKALPPGFEADPDDESGQREVYLRPYPGPGSRIKVSTNGGEEPAWARGGRELFYRAGDQFFSVDLSTDPEPLPGTPKVLFTGPFKRAGREDSPLEYDVSADGKEFIAIQSQRPPEVTRQLVVLTGLFGPDRTGGR